MQLYTGRLLLREWVAADAPALADGLSDRHVSQWFPHIPHPYTEQDAAQFIRCCQSAATAPERTVYEFAITLRTNNSPIGGIALSRIDVRRGTAGGGIWIRKTHHGHGYGFEAWQRRIQFAFEELGLRRLENGFFEGNEASKKMQLKSGYQIEGMRRESFICVVDGLPRNEVQTGLLKREWIRDSQ